MKKCENCNETFDFGREIFYCPKCGAPLNDK